MDSFLKVDRCFPPDRVGMKTYSVFKYMCVATIIIVASCFMTFTMIAQQTLADYSNFTSERQSIVEKMGEFFDKTIRKNFPATTDTASYHVFFNCFFVGNAPPESQYILQIDRKKLAEINAELFKDKNYYFFISDIC